MPNERDFESHQIKGPITRRLWKLPTVVIILNVMGTTLAVAQPFSGFTPGNLVLSRSVYSGTASTVTVGQQLPPVCGAQASCTGKATNNGTYPGIWFNDSVDGSFGVTSPIYLDQITPTGSLINELAIPTDVVVTSFSSKSELALNLSLDGAILTFMGYVAQPNTLDVSNSNTPGVIDPTNPVGSAYYRAVVQVYANGAIHVTPTNAYSGNNGRAAIFADGLYYTTGNSNNGSGTPANVVTSTGVEIVVPFQTPGTPVEVGDFSITQVINPSTGMPYAADKLGKDNNFRGLTIFNKTLYVTKGSGGNGINTVYQVGNAGSLPTLANAATTPITILPGFPTVLAKNTAAATNPFGIWFANANTLYVADEGDGTMADAATSKAAGLEKWSLVNGVWQLDYVLQNGLNLGQPYSIPNYPTSLNPATDGLRNITGRVNGDGTVTIWAVTSTVSASGDQGADPNKLVTITDQLANTDPSVANTEQFTTLRTAAFGEVLRGVSFTPLVNELEYNFYVKGTTTVGASLLFPGVVRDITPASVPYYSFNGFISPSPASMAFCNLTSNSSAELDCRGTDPHSGVFYFVFDHGTFASGLGPFSGAGFIAPDGTVPGLNTVVLEDGRVSIAQ